MTTRHTPKLANSPAADTINDAQSGTAGPQTHATSDGNNTDRDPARALDDQADGKQLLDHLQAFIAQYAILPSQHCMVAVALWIAHTWALPAMDVTPRLILNSPEPACGKTRVLELLELLCRNPQMMFPTTAKALRSNIEAADGRPPTILLDEIDTVFGPRGTRSADLRVLINSSYRRGLTGEGAGADGLPRALAPVAMAGIAGGVPPTIRTRAITIDMRPPGPGEHTKRWKPATALADAAPLKDRLQVWAEQNEDRLAAAEPKMPDGIQDRSAEIWTPLLAIADLAGSDWANRVRAACRYFTNAANTTDMVPPGRRLLADTRAVFAGRERMFSDDVVAALIADPESPWTQRGRDALDVLRLARDLGRYGVRSHTMRIGADRRKGYQITGDDGLVQAWDRYLPSQVVDDDPTGCAVTGHASSTPGRDAAVTPEKPADQQDRDGVTGVTGVTDKAQEPDGPATVDRDGLRGGGVLSQANDAPPETTPDEIREVDTRPHIPGDLKPHSPGQTDRVHKALARGGRGPC